MIKKITAKEGACIIHSLDADQITSYSASTLLDQLRFANSTISCLTLNRNSKIDDDVMIALGEFIKSSKTIELITIHEARISDKGIGMLAGYLDGNTSLKYLSFDTNKDITDASIPLLISIIERSHLEYLGVFDTLIERNNVFAAPLACNSLRYRSRCVEIVDRYFDDDDTEMICKHMKMYDIQNLKEINISGNKIAARGMSILFQTLREYNSKIQYLHLSFNTINEQAMKELGEFIENDEYLEELHVEGCKITDKEVEIFSDHMQGNTTLKSVFMNSNIGITNASVPQFLSMAKHSNLVFLGLLDTSISKEMDMEIRDALRILVDKRQIMIKSKSKSAAKANT